MPSPLYLSVVIYASVQGFVKYVLRTSPALDSAHFSKPIMIKFTSYLSNFRATMANSVDFELKGLPATSE
jgi:hypothetical protein